ncbi:MAG: tRNA pseudouridine(55) synthase TruB [Clostridia bacterium]|nr:tRNA pseudouridine(55) synthase TruB [Clostridia bacterium]
MTDNNSIIGVINIYKEKGYTSHDVVNIVRKQLGRIKTGHTGTLDPDAEGVLPVCVGKATKLADYIAADIKEYKAELTLGITTTTEDISGDVIEEKDVNCSSDDVIAAIKSFVGEYNQKPPMYSAVKVNGKKLYELAREGKEIERKTRLINIYEIRNIKALDKKRYEFYVLCSKGTYIRTLCRDIGERLGCGGCMSDLTRTRSGSFYIEDSIKIEDFKALAAEGKIKEFLIPVEDVLSNYKKVHISPKAEKYVLNGNKISISYLKEKDIKSGDKIVAEFSDKKTVGIYEVIGDFIKPITMLI